MTCNGLGMSRVSNSVAPELIISLRWIDEDFAAQNVQRKIIVYKRVVINICRSSISQQGGNHQPIYIFDLDISTVID